MFHPSITLAAAQGGIGGSDLIDALTVACRIPWNRSIAENLNSPRSSIRISESGFGAVNIDAAAYFRPTGVIVTITSYRCTGILSRWMCLSPESG
jgi:hypothetical protein